MAKTLYMVVEHFKNLERCYQLMETEEPTLLDQSIANWSDVTDFEVYPVLTSKQAAEKIAPLLAASPERSGG
jgi:hypothetical protein